MANYHQSFVADKQWKKLSVKIYNDDMCKIQEILAVGQLGLIKLKSYFKLSEGVSEFEPFLDHGVCIRLKEKQNLGRFGR